jgi:hypothetical protein
MRRTSVAIHESGVAQRWHIASGLPKPSELAVAAGSAYLILQN